MPYVLKIEALLDLESGQEIEITERCFYGGNTIGAGDEAFLWFSGTVQQLAWSAQVTTVGDYIDGRVTVAVQLMLPSSPHAIRTSQLVPFRDIYDGSVISTLSKKLYKQSHNKIAFISDEEALFLRAYFSQSVCVN